VQSGKMILVEKAQELLEEWELYKHAHYTDHSVEFHEVLDNEFNKGTVKELVVYVQQALLDDTMTETDFNLRVSLLDSYLTKYKNHITIELLKHGR
jgi:hypothetical protein